MFFLTASTFLKPKLPFKALVKQFLLMTQRSIFNFINNLKIIAQVLILRHHRITSQNILLHLTNRFFDQKKVFISQNHEKDPPKGTHSVSLF